MFFGFQLTCGLMMVFYGYTVMKNPRVWGEQAAGPSRRNISMNTADRTACSS